MFLWSLESSANTFTLQCFTTRNRSLIYKINSRLRGKQTEGGRVRRRGTEEEELEGGGLRRKS